MALTDVDGVYGSARFHMSAKKTGIQAHIGAEVTAKDGGRYTLLVQSRTGYQNLSRLITRMKLRAGAKIRNQATSPPPHSRTSENSPKVSSALPEATKGRSLSASGTETPPKPWPA